MYVSLVAFCEEKVGEGSATGSASDETDFNVVNATEYHFGEWYSFLES